MLKSDKIINSWPIHCNQHCTREYFFHQLGSSCIKTVTQDIHNIKTISFLYFLVSLVHKAQLWAEWPSMLCSTLNLGCEITTNSKQLIGTAKWEDILKLYETKKQTVPYHLLPNVMHSLLKPGW